MYKQVIDEIRQGEYNTDNVKAAAHKLLSVKNMGTPLRIIEMCRGMGFSVYQQDLPRDVCGYIAIDGELRERFNTDRIISVNINESNKRRRFTVAHELAHFLFDFKPNTVQFYNAFEENHAADEIEDASEHLANRFAAELLMPEEKFRKAYDKFFKKHDGSSEQLYNTVQDLSDLFLAPQKAVELRIKKELKLHE